MFNYFNTIFTVYDQKSAKKMQFCTKVVHGKSWRHRTRLVLHGWCKMTFSSTGSWCGNPCPICKKNHCANLILSEIIFLSVAIFFIPLDLGRKRSIAHKHKDLHAQTSHQAQTSHHWRGISFHWKCLFNLV